MNKFQFASNFLLVMWPEVLVPLALPLSVFAANWIIELLFIEKNAYSLVILSSIFLTIIYFIVNLHGGHDDQGFERRQRKFGVGTQKTRSKVHLIVGAFALSWLIYLLFP